MTSYEDQNTISIRQVEAQVRGFMKGKILTVLDACLSDPTQRDAVKQLIKEKIDSQVDWMCYGDNTPSEDSESNDTVAARNQYEQAPADEGMYILPKEKLLSIIELENAWDHVGHVKSEYTDAYELLLPLGKDHTLKLIVDSEAIKDSGFFEEV